MFFADDLVAAVALVASKFPNISSNFVRGVPIIYMKYMKCMKNYIISQVILAFWLALTYDLLDDRCTIEVIITNFFPLLL